MKSHKLFEKEFGNKVEIANGSELHTIPLAEIFSNLETGKLIYFENANCTFEDFVSISNRIITTFYRDPSSYGYRAVLSDDNTVYEAVKGDEAVPPHGELYSLPNPPDLLLLYCQKPAPIGGETTFYCGSSMTEDLSPETRQILTRSSFIYRHQWGRPQWEHVFETTDREEALDRIRSWPSTSVVSTEGDIFVFEYETTAFSHRDGSSLVNGIVNILSRKGQRLNEVLWKGGHEIDKNIVDELNDVARRSECALRLKAGEFVLVDNHKVMHGRRSFIGERKMAARFGSRAFL